MAPDRRRAGVVGWYLLLTALSVAVLFPIWMTLVRALSNPITWSFERGQPPYPVDVEWDVFARAFDEADFDRQLLISVAATAIIVTGQLVTSVVAAYAFAFVEFPFKRTLFALTMATLMLPIEVNTIEFSRLNDSVYEDVGRVTSRWAGAWRGTSPAGILSSWLRPPPLTTFRRFPFRLSFLGRFHPRRRNFILRSEGSFPSLLPALPSSTKEDLLLRSSAGASRCRCR